MNNKINLWLHRVILWFVVASAGAFTYGLYCLPLTYVSLWYVAALFSSYCVAFGIVDEHIPRIKRQIRSRYTVRICPECHTVEGLPEPTGVWRCPHCLDLMMP